MSKTPHVALPGVVRPKIAIELLATCAPYLRDSDYDVPLAEVGLWAVEGSSHLKIRYQSEIALP